MTVQPEAPETEERSGLSRRTVIKGAAHAAWMVPAITVVTQAPALAASGDAPPVLSISNASAKWSGSGTGAALTIAFTVTNSSPAQTAGLSAQLKFSSGWIPSNSEYTSISGPWAPPTKSSPTFTFNATSQIGRTRSSVTFSAVFTPSNQSNGGKTTVIDVSVMPGGPGNSAGTELTSLKK